MIATCGATLICGILAYLFSMQENTVVLIQTGGRVLTLLQAMLLVIAPILFGGMERLFRPKTCAFEAKVFSLWYSRKKRLFIATFYLIVAFSIVCSLMAALWARGVYSMLGWISAAASLDFLFYAMHSVERHTKPSKLMLMVQNEVKKASRSQEMSRLISQYEMLFLVMGDCIQRGDSLALKEAQDDFIRSVHISLDALPRLTLYQQDGVDENLIDRLSFFEAIASRRMSSLLNSLLCTYEAHGDTAIIDRIFEMSARLFLTFHERHASLGFVLLQSLRQKLMEYLQRSSAGSHRDPQLLSQFAIMLSECIKSLLDSSLRTKRGFASSLSQLLILLETVMKDQFRLHRAMNPALLMQPFAEIGQYLGGSKFQELPDREAILSQLKQLLSQFAVLETLSERLDIQGARTDTEATYKEDLPFSGTPSS